MPNIDFHCHSEISDGLHPPCDVVRFAATNGVDVLALTDHDNLGGLAQAREAASAHGIRFIDGVEISVTWTSKTLHIVGVNIDPSEANLRTGLELFAPAECNVPRKWPRVWREPASAACCKAR